MTNARYIAADNGVASLDGVLCVTSAGPMAILLIYKQQRPALFGGDSSERVRLEYASGDAANAALAKIKNILVAEVMIFGDEDERTNA